MTFNNPKITELKQSYQIKESDSALSFGSGSYNVYSTPSMIALMENTAHLLANKLIDNKHSTVGIEIHAKHLKAKKTGEKITCHAQLLKADERILKFHIEVYDDNDLIGTATHKRVIVNTKKFLEKL